MQYPFRTDAWACRVSAKGIAAEDWFHPPLQFLMPFGNRRLTESRLLSLAAAGRRIVNQAEIPHIAIEGEQRMVSENRIENIGRIFMAALQIHRVAVKKGPDILPPVVLAAKIFVEDKRMPPPPINVIFFIADFPSALSGAQSFSEP